MNFLKSSWLVIVATVVMVTLYWLRPGGISGPEAAPVPPPEVGFDHSAWTTVLQRVVAEDGTVDYKALAGARGDLDRYLGMIRGTSPASAPHRFKTDKARLAYYINAYNAFVLAGVLESCPLNSVQDAYFSGGFFWRVGYAMGDSKVTLDTVEQELIREVFRHNGAIHFVLSKAAKGSAPLERTAFSEEDVLDRLEQAATRITADERYVRREGDTLHLSQLFEWYKGDLGDPIAYIKKYNAKVVEGSPSVKFVPVDWSLNGVCPERRPCQSTPSAHPLRPPTA
ncbi:MAG: DUF547 domain-containing protein [Bradymonadia bacterium]